MRLVGKVAIISGAASGMGAATARLLAREGAKVVIGDVPEREGRQVADAIGASAQFELLDVTKEEGWAAVVAATTRHFGKLDVLVNNAGISGSAEQDFYSTEAWHRIMAVNATGVFFGIKYAIPAMVTNGGRLDRQSVVDRWRHRQRARSHRVQCLQGGGTADDQMGRGAGRQGQHPRQLGSSRDHAANAHIRSHRRSCRAGRTHARHSDGPARRS